MQSKSMDWFLYDVGLRHERVKVFHRKKFLVQKFGCYFFPFVVLEEEVVLILRLI